MSSTIDKMESHHLRADVIAHLVDRTRRLVGAPIAFSRDVLGRHIYGPTRKGVHLGNTPGTRAPPYAIALQRAGETGPGVFGSIHFDLAFGQPFAIRDVIRRR